ncbi:hypothetical protein COU17_00005 [Candidatus Kaiserbacteria bacterium CG10_big_fil_rev_8_21_14_0_10_49_17]|uniref:Uncharacterized protein n=1 Tax=Candidatus Kaiserbacteria bacterium CG10_big_fil_rev_8_21_14_0_10_49_17 TaxID=1974609 RepID=A0A2M6WFG0_9BACT|nr:MAG: hypothetical protein COU17_00005 [Candidatus Kaiserbacteria bacterium CG10_big_fil_rev_8_21_14_0_10_49_17]
MRKWLHAVFIALFTIQPAQAKKEEPIDPQKLTFAIVCTSFEAALIIAKHYNKSDIGERILLVRTLALRVISIAVDGTVKGMCARGFFVLRIDEHVSEFAGADPKKVDVFRGQHFGWYGRNGLDDNAEVIYTELKPPFIPKGTVFVVDQLPAMKRIWRKKQVAGPAGG